MSIRNVHDLTIHGSLRNSSNEVVSLDNILHDGEVDLSDYSTTSEANALYATSSTVSSAITAADVPGQIDAKISTALAPYPSGSTVSALVNMYSASSVVHTEDDTPTSLFHVDLYDAIPSHTGLHLIKVSVLGRSELDNWADNDALAMELNMSVFGASDAPYLLESSDSYKNCFSSSTAWTVTASLSGSGPTNRYLDIYVTGDASKKIQWKGFMERKELQTSSP